jgi:hypothetical protein
MPAPSFGERVLSFYESLRPPRSIPRGVEVLAPYRTPLVRDCMQRFYHKFFSDSHERVFILGINPGRFGAGVSGIPFTDGVALETLCGISNELPRRRELSAEFVQMFIERLGGASAFYGSFFITAVCPIGFTRGGRNLNYYDDRALYDTVRPFMVRMLNRQIDFGARRAAAIVLGAGENLREFTALNERHRFFESLIGLDHPRFIMQYRRKRLREYLDRYEKTLCATAGSALRKSTG